MCCWRGSPLLLPRRTSLDLIQQSRIEGLLCATTFTTIDYLLTQSLPRPESREADPKLLELFEVWPVNCPVIEEAFQSRILDFEEAILEQAGRLAGVHAIVTCNTRDFRNSSVKALEPDELLSAIKK